MVALLRLLALLLLGLSLALLRLALRLLGRRLLLLHHLLLLLGLLPLILALFALLLVLLRLLPQLLGPGSYKLLNLLFLNLLLILLSKLGSLQLFRLGLPLNDLVSDNADGLLILNTCGDVVPQFGGVALAIEVGVEEHPEISKMMVCLLLLLLLEGELVLDLERADEELHDEVGILH